MNLTLIRGLPGSGKSTLAKRLGGEQPQGSGYSMGIPHFEADQYHMVDGEYRFDINRLGKAHEYCFTHTSNYLSNGYSVIVSNTFTRSREIRPYLDLATIYKARVMIIECQGEYGSIHNVPEDTMQNMRDRFVNENEFLLQYLEFYGKPFEGIYLYKK